MYVRIRSMYLLVAFVDKSGNESVNRAAHNGDKAPAAIPNIGRGSGMHRNRVGRHHRRHGAGHAAGANVCLVDYVEARILTGLRFFANKN